MDKLSKLIYVTCEMQQTCEMSFLLGFEALGFEPCQSEAEIIDRKAMYEKKTALLTRGKDSQGTGQTVVLINAGVNEIPAHSLASGSEISNWL